jgi:O-antigen ligase
MEIQIMTGAVETGSWELHRERRFMLLISAVFTLVFVQLVSMGGGRVEALLFLPVVTAVLVFFRSVALALAGLVIMLFTAVTVSYFTASVAFSAVVAVAFIIHRRDIVWNELVTPLTIPILVYGLSVLPSLINAPDPFHCITLMFNAVAFLVVLYATYLTVRDPRSARNLVMVYLGLTLLNAIVLILISLSTARRQYGFASIMYVDYAGMGVNLFAAMTMMASGRRRMLFLGATLIVGAALILTQTRNSWISAFIVLIFSVVYLIRYPVLTGMNRSQLLRSVFIGVVFLVFLASLVLLINPSIEERATSIAETESVESGETIVVRNTLISRMMIWNAALNAFQAHPIVGIGVYGFAKASRQYSHLPAALYDHYVRDLSAHVTFIAVLSETGLLGMAGFLMFLIATLRTASRSVRNATSLSLQRRAFLGLVALVYCTVSMFFTDAWLWGHGIVLLGLIIGLVLANRRMSLPEEQPSPLGAVTGGGA